MSAVRIHEGEVTTDTSLVRRLLATQFPQWASLPLSRVPSAGTDNAMYRLGSDLVVRLPRIDWAVEAVRKEVEWLPRLAPHLPWPVPQPVALGKPAEIYPYPWSVYRWINGEEATLRNVRDRHELARDLANFILALRAIPLPSADVQGAMTSNRGGRVAVVDEPARAAIAACEGLLDGAALTAAWEVALDAPVGREAPVWLHGDLKPGNLLASGGRLSAVIDFGGLAVGDPAVDLLVAWNLLDAGARQTFRKALTVDEATWLRARAWALAVGLFALPYYQHTNPGLAAVSRYQLGEVLDDLRLGR